MKNTKKLLIISMMIAIGVVLQIAESLLPVPIPLPGGKLGLANVISLICMPIIGIGATFAVALVRAFLGSVLFGGFISSIYSVSGAFLSVIIIILMRKYFSNKVSEIGLGVVAAIAHNTAQVFVATILFNNAGIFVYLPILTLISVISGGFTGYIAKILLDMEVIGYDKAK